ncbi:MAG: hypothetical protein JXB26_00655 [Candidatus Aminicenantes bacterium]|nr:hypothetical protein [Candidatus Aminicenantes bacterium]
MNGISNSIKNKTVKSKDNNGRWWVRIHLASIQEIPQLQKKYKIEIFPPSFRRIDKKNVLVDAYISKGVLDDMKSKYTVRILGDVEKLAKQASTYVSKVNRYKKK